MNENGIFLFIIQSCNMYEYVHHFLSVPSQIASIIGLIWEYSVYLPCYSYHLYLFWDFWLSMWNGINLHYLGQHLLD